MDKKSLILELIIQEYLKCMEPISSKHLMDSISLKISSASIRNYFNKLGDEGSLSQLHISSGRVPTHIALQEYWVNKISAIEEFKYDSIQTLDQRADILDIFYILELSETNYLIDIQNIDNKFILLIFEHFEMVVKYVNTTYRFLDEFKNYEINELISVAKSLGAYDIASEINSFKLHKNLFFGGLNTLTSMSSSSEYIKSSLNADVLNSLNNGFYFSDVVSDGYMGIKSEIVVDNKKANMFCAGELNRDFSYFLAS